MLKTGQFVRAPTKGRGETCCAAFALNHRIKLQRASRRRVYKGPFQVDSDEIEVLVSAGTLIRFGDGLHAGSAHRLATFFSLQLRVFATLLRPQKQQHEGLRSSADVCLWNLLSA